MSQAQFYDDPDRRTYRFPVAAVATAAIFGRIVGPNGKTGRIRGLEYVVTTATTVAASIVTVGKTAAAGPVSITIPVASANAVGALTAAQEKAAGAKVVAGTNDVELPADVVIELASNGGSTAGAADILLTVDWF